MEFQRIQNAIELFGPAPPRPPAPPNRVEPTPEPQREAAKTAPRLEIGWGGFHQGLWTSVVALFGPSNVQDAQGSAFRDSWVEGSVPRRAVIAAALWHVAFLAMPFSLLTGTPHRNPLFQNVEITWRGPIDDLPLLEIPREKPTHIANVKPAEPIAAPVVEAFHPRQRIYTDPVHPNHPRQTLINPKAPPIAPKLLANLPNMVQFQQLAGPAKPRLEISEEMLKKLRPKEKRAASTTVAPPVNMPNMEPQVAELSLPTAQSGPARPKLQLNAGAAPRLAARNETGDAGPAPEVRGTQITAANGGPSALIALSATPAPPAPVEPPKGNLAAKIAISPEGRVGADPGAGGLPAKDGTAGGASKGAVGISISGGDPAANAGARMSAPAPKLITRPEPKAETEDAVERTGPPDFGSLPPGAKPEAIFASKKVYTLNVNMPNLNSSTGSWILNFSELHADSARRYTPAATNLSGPVPLKKVDPKYPQTLISERVAGEVILYAVIRRDGSVDDIQLVRGVDEQLDKNAMSALSQWKFKPGAKQGTPIELEAIVHIPFRLPED